MDWIPLNLRGIIVTSIAFVVLMFIYIYMNSKSKLDYNNTTGRITYLDKKLGELPTRHIGKYRYMAIDGYEYPFEIFVGKETGDFKPKFEQIDNLKPGDTVTVYYYQIKETKEEGINRFIQFIDKNDESYFERGDSSKTLGIVVISLSILLTIGGLVLWKLGKIEY